MNYENVKNLKQRDFNACAESVKKLLPRCAKLSANINEREGADAKVTYQLKTNSC